MFFHEGSAHVPFVLRLPKSWQARCHGSTVGTPVTHADILPTLCAAAGGKPPPAACDGQNLLAVARGETPGREFLEATCNNGQYYALTDARWKYIFYPEGGQEQLFDLATDPDELLDLSRQTEHDAKRRELRDEMTRRHIARDSKAVETGRLIETPLKHDPPADRRANAWPGYHTEHYGVDVRH